MNHYIFKNEDSISPDGFSELEELLVPLFSFSYHFMESYRKTGQLYYGSRPKWRLFLRDEDKLIGSLAIVERKLTKPFPLKIGGIGALGIKGSHQNQGFGGMILTKAHELMKREGFDVSMLFCLEKLKGFYLKCGYRLVNNPVVFTED